MAAGHRGAVAARLVAAQRRGGQLAVGQLDVVAGRRAQHGAQRVVAHLVAEAAAAGVDEHGHAIADQAERGRGLLVVDLGHVAQLAEVVAGAERAELGTAALLGPLRHLVRLGALDAAALLGVVEVAGAAVALGHGPARAAHQHAVELGGAELAVAARADAGRDGAVERGGQLGQAAAQLVALEPARQQAHAAVDVVADAAGRQHALLGVERGHAADREAVAPVDVRHGDRVADDAGQVGDVDHLLGAAVVADVGDQIGGRVDQPRHPHAAALRDAVAEVVDSLQLDRHAHLSVGSRSAGGRLRRR